MKPSLTNTSKQETPTNVDNTTHTYTHTNSAGTAVQRSAEKTHLGQNEEQRTHGTHRTHTERVTKITSVALNSGRLKTRKTKVKSTRFFPKKVDSDS